MRSSSSSHFSFNFMANPINFNCRDFKCKDTVVSLYDLVGENLEVKLTGNKSYLGLPNRTLGDDGGSICQPLSTINYSFTTRLGSCS